MAKDSSFDVVSEVDVMELDNALSQTQRELTQRYDLKDSGATIELSKKDGVLTIAAPSEFVASQVRDILGSKMVKRGLDLRAISWASAETASAGTVRQKGTVVQGLSTELAKKISKEIKDLKLKCKPTVEGDKLRVSSASRDVLQEVISYLKEQDYGQALQYTNYR